MRRPAAASAAALALLVAGCGGGADRPLTTAEPAPPIGTGYYVGAAGGIGASLDLSGDDPVSRAVERALLAAPGPAEPLTEVGIASIVNDTPTGFPLPGLVAILEGGRAVVMQPALAALRGARGTEARRARAALRRAAGRVPPRGTAVEYVVMRGARLDQIASVTMSAGPSPSITLAAAAR